MVLAFLGALAAAAPVDDLLALPDAEARLAAARDLATSLDAGLAAQGSAAVQVLERLASAGRTDPAVVRGFLEAALSTDPALRLAALEAADHGGLPPVARAPAPVAPAPVAPAAGPGSVLPSPSRPALDPLLREPAPPSVSRHPPAWVVRYSDGSPLSTPELMRALGDIELERRYLRTQHRAIGVGAALAVPGTLAVGLGAYSAPFLLFPGFRTVGLVGVGLIAGGITLDGLALGPLLRHARRERDPSVFLTTEEVDRAIAAHNAGP